MAASDFEIKPSKPRLFTSSLSCSPPYALKSRIGISGRSLIAVATSHPLESDKEMSRISNSGFSS